MIQFRRWLLIYKDCLLYAVLATVIVYFKHGDKYSNQQAKPITDGPVMSIAEFGEAYTKKYGTYRVLTDSICLYDGKCVLVADSLAPFTKEFALVRKILTTDQTRVSSTLLKLPEVLTEANLDSSAWDVDTSVLPSGSYMETMLREIFASGAVSPEFAAPLQVLSIGLGSGYMNSFLHQHFLNMNITAVELDPKMYEIAQKWFKLHTNDRHRVVVEDGLSFIKRAALNGERYDVLLLDACTINEYARLMCPVNGFIANKAVDLVSKVTGAEGVFIAHLHSLQYDITAIAEELKPKFERHFHNCALKTTQSNSDMVLTCSHHAHPNGLDSKLQDFVSGLKEVNIED